MADIDREQIRETTERWLERVVIGLGFCPFAASVHNVDGGLAIEVLEASGAKLFGLLLQQLEAMDQKEQPETALLVIPAGLEDFEIYLDFLADAEDLMHTEGYEGIYQLASFHPQYCFDSTAFDDASNFTNRSPFPMIHILREASLTRHLVEDEDAMKIPERNIRKAREEGYDNLQTLLDSCKSGSKQGQGQ